MFNTTDHFVSNSLVCDTDPTKRLTLAGGDLTLEVHSVGITAFQDSEGGRVEFRNSLYIPSLNKTLIAGGALVKAGVHSVVNPSNPVIFAMMCNRRQLFDGFFSGNLMVMRLNPLKVNTSILPFPQLQKSQADANNSLLLAHKRLGHVNKQYLCRMIVKESVKGLENVSRHGDINCFPCIKAKSQSLPFSGTRPRSTYFLENVHVDLGGIIRNESLDHTSYFILFTNDYSSMRFIYPLKSKNKECVFPIIKNFIVYAERQTNCHLESFTLDCGSFFNSPFFPFCDEVGITLHSNEPYTPSQNGVSEAANQTINAKARAMLLTANLSQRFWYHASETAVFIHNRTICKVSGDLEITPFEIWNKRKPDINHIRVFGCAAQILIRKSQRGGKFEEVTEDGVLVGFVDDNFNYKVFNFDLNQGVVSHNVYFDEERFPFKSHPPSPIIEEDLSPPSPPTIAEPPKDTSPTNQHDNDPITLPTLDSDELSVPTPDNDEHPLSPPISTLNPETVRHHPTIRQPPPLEPRRSERIRNKASCSTPSANINSLADEPSPRVTASLSQAQVLHNTFWHNPNAFINNPHSPDAYAFAVSETPRLIDEPRKFSEAMKSPKSASWKVACDKEIASIAEKGVWHLVPRPANRNVIKGRWVFKIKLNVDGSISKFKARYVAKGYSQVEGVDFFETLSPTGKPASFRVFVAMAASQGWDIEEMDAVSAFLNCKCEEELYLELPEGYRGNKGMVARLEKTLYGLKQSARNCIEDVCSFLISIGFKPSDADACVYTRTSTDSTKFSAVYVHVDNMGITGNDIAAVKQSISS